MDKLVCFKCNKDIRILHKGYDCLPCIGDAEFAKLEFGYGSKFDMGCTGYTDSNDHVYRGDLLEVLVSNSVYALICDDCFEEHYKKLLVYRKTTNVEFKRIR